MIVLDTDHVTALKYPEHPRAKQLTDKLGALSVKLTSRSATGEKS